MSLDDFGVWQGEPPGVTQAQRETLKEKYPLADWWVSGYAASFNPSDGWAAEAVLLYREHMALLRDHARLQEEREQMTSIHCPACGLPVAQVASATLSLALWQHWNWACSKRPRESR
jgi:hypothetical protein